MADGLCRRCLVDSGSATGGCCWFPLHSSSNDATAHHFGQSVGTGTIPHALIGYAGSTVLAAQMFHESFPQDDLTVWIDYCEITDYLVVARCFPDLVESGRLAVRMDTTPNRFVEGLDDERSRTVFERHVPTVRGLAADDLHHQMTYITSSVPASRLRRCGTYANRWIGQDFEQYARFFA